MAPRPTPPPSVGPPPVSGRTPRSSPPTNAHQLLNQRHVRASVQRIVRREPGLSSAKYIDTGLGLGTMGLLPESGGSRKCHNYLGRPHDGKAKRHAQLCAISSWRH
jgi:hypothetical protein